MAYVSTVIAALVWVQLSWSALCLSLQRQQKVEKRRDGEHSAKDDLHTCLKGKRIVFVGPSTSKFDYMATAYFAEYGKFPTEEQVADLSGAAGPNPLNEQKVGAALPKMQAKFPAVLQAGCQAADKMWEQYYRYSNAFFNGREHCDCYRFGEWTKPEDLYNNTENRIYNNGDTMLAYFQWFGDVVLPRGTYNILPLLAMPAQAAQPQCPVGQFPGTWSWAVSIDRFLSTVVRFARPTHLVVSSAYWPVRPEDTTLWTNIANAGVEAVMDTGGQVIWRNTPQREDISFHYKSPRIAPSVQAGMTKAGWKFWDTQSVVNEYKGSNPWSEVFYDNAHLHPAAESHVANAFLKTYVCPEMR